MIQFLGMDVLTFLSGDNSILNSSMVKLSIENFDNRLNIVLCFKLLKSGVTEIIEIYMQDVKEYSLYYNRLYGFYNVTSYKLFVEENNVYLSLDPADESDTPSPDDQDYIVSDYIKCVVKD